MMGFEVVVAGWERVCTWPKRVYGWQEVIRVMGLGMAAVGGKVHEGTQVAGENT